MLKKTLQETSERIDQAIRNQSPRLSAREIGRLSRMESGIAQVTGLPGVKAMELLRFVNGSMGIAFNLDQDEIGVVLLESGSNLKAGSEVRRTGRVIDVPVGQGLLGRVVDGLGNPLDDAGPIRAEDNWPIEREAPEIMDRDPVIIPLQTGIKAIDALIPIGRGQRQLVLGDRQTGKTAIALDTMLNQHDKNVICVYCSIGQRGSATAKVIDTLVTNKAMEYCVVVVASGDDAAGLQFVAPYAATSIAEYFMLQGRDVLVVYDDLTRHAHSYREISLLLRRPPGREAYPGDIFYIHSRLLERSTHLKKEAGGGSLTAMPIIETQAQNLSSYIPTNLISITDGQVYLSPDLFQKGELPAVDVGKSVSRVGGKAQLPAYQIVAGELRLAYTQFEELETFARFGARLDEQTRQSIERGRRVREILKQNMGDLFTAAEQIILLLVVNHGLFDALTLDQVKIAELALRQTIKDKLESQCLTIHSGQSLDEAERQRVLQVVRDVIEQFNPLENP